MYLWSHWISWQIATSGSRIHWIPRQNTGADLGFMWISRRNGVCADPWFHDHGSRSIESDPGIHYQQVWLEVKLSDRYRGGGGAETIEKRRWKTSKERLVCCSFWIKRNERALHFRYSGKQYANRRTKAKHRSDTKQHILTGFNSLGL